MAKIVTMGEIMLRITSPEHLRLLQGRTFEEYFGGSEANVAVSLAMMGDEVSYITRLPGNAMGQKCRNELRRYNVNTDSIIWGGKRLGSYFFERAASLRSSSIVYDRAGSAFTELQPHDINWKKTLEGHQVFHWSGISCAVSESASLATLEGLNEAEQMGLYTSLDINYRKNLWNYGREAKEVILPAAKKCDFIFGDTNEWQMLVGKSLPSFKATDADYKMDLNGYLRFFEEAQRQLPKCRYMLMGIRNVVSANHHLLTGLLWAEGRLYSTKIYDINPVLDPVGVGDAFVAAYLHAFFRWKGDHQYCLDYSLTASAMKNTVMGDFNLITEQEVLDCMESMF